MGFGFLASVYEKYLMIELKKAGVSAEAQVSINVEYGGEIVGEFIADVLFEGSVILEFKSDRRIVRAHEIQLVNYLVATGKEIGLILNFQKRRLRLSARCGV